MSPDSADAAQWNEIKQILDEEVNRLPEKLRLAFVLFHYEQRPLAETAALLGTAVPTASTWLRRARETLAGRLKRRGIMIGAAAMTAMLAECVAAEPVSAAFVAAMLQTVSGVSAAGLAACTTQVSALVRAGAAGGISKFAWAAASLGAAAVVFPLALFWMLPALQTRQSPDFPLLQGEWREVVQEQNGGPVNAVPRVEYVSTLQIAGRNFHRQQMLADGRVLEGGSGSLVLDNAQSPAAVDFKQWQGTVYGIYQLEGDALTLCVTRDGGPRPGGFVTKQSDDRILSRYERVR